MGCTAAGTALLPQWLCPLCCPMGLVHVLEKATGARLSLWQGTFWEGPGLYSCSMAACGARGTQNCGVAVTEQATYSVLGIIFRVPGGLRKLWVA